jgi:hypothetical protein
MCGAGRVWCPAAGPLVGSGRAEPPGGPQPPPTASSAHDLFLAAYAPDSLEGARGTRARVSAVPLPNCCLASASAWHACAAFAPRARPCLHLLRTRLWRLCPIVFLALQPLAEVWCRQEFSPRYARPCPCVRVCRPLDGRMAFQEDCADFFGDYCRRSACPSPLNKTNKGGASWSACVAVHDVERA